MVRNKIKQNHSEEAFHSGMLWLVTKGGEVAHRQGGTAEASLACLQHSHILGLCMPFTRMEFKTTFK